MSKEQEEGDRCRPPQSKTIGVKTMNSIIKRECREVIGDREYMNRFIAFIDSEVEKGFGNWLEETGLPNTRKNRKAYRCAFLSGGLSTCGFLEMMDDELPSLVSEVMARSNGEDPDTMRIVYLRCVEGVETWQKVAERMGEGWTSAACKVRFHRYKKALNNRLR